MITLISNTHDTGSRLLSPKALILFACLMAWFSTKNLILASVNMTLVENALSRWEQQGTPHSALDYYDVKNAVQRANALEPGNSAYMSMQAEVLTWGTELGYEPSFHTVDEMLAVNLKPIEWLPLIPDN